MRRATAEGWAGLLASHVGDETAAVVVDRDFVLRAANPQASELLGIDPDDALGRSITDLLHPDDLDRAITVFGEAREHDGLRPPGVYRIGLDGRDHRTLDVAGETIDGGAAVVFRLSEPSQRTRSEVLAMEQVEVMELMAAGRPVDECLIALAVMAERNLDETGSVVLTVADGSTLRSFAAPSCPPGLRSRWQGHPATQLEGNLAEAAERGLTHIDADPDLGPEHVVATTPVMRADGSIVGFVEAHLPRGPATTNSAMAIYNLVGRLLGVVVERFGFEQRLERAANTDMLTGLGNRRALGDALGLLTEGKADVAVLALDLDRFSALNNTQGHAAGDEVLIEVARRLRRVAPSGAGVFRPGGDEFLMIVPGERRTGAVHDLGRRIIEAVGDPIPLSTGEWATTVSVGATTTTGRSIDADRLLAQADTAMYSAKRAGGGQVRLYHEPSNDRLVHSLALAADLPAAIDDQQLSLDFQPVVDLATLQIQGVEALVRWDHPTLGVIGPDAFVPLAEESALVERLDRWVLGRAAERAGRWAERSTSDFTVWVNLSARTLQVPDLADTVRAVADHHGVRVGVELTERDRFEDTEAAHRAFERLRRADVPVAMDDFGTGQSSLYRAVFYEPTSLKIDRSFVAEMGRSDRAMVIVETIIGLAHRLEVEVIAEGIERPDQLRTLRDLGCHHGQGYLFARPMGPGALERRFGAALEHPPEI